MLWSLNLSHLRYYGNPVIVKSDNREERLTMKHLLIAVLAGFLFS